MFNNQFNSPILFALKMKGHNKYTVWQKDYITFFLSRNMEDFLYKRHFLNLLTHQIPFV